MTEGAAKKSSRVGTKRAPRRVVAVVDTEIEERRAIAIAIAREATKSKCTDVVVLEVAGMSPVCDFIVIGTGTSSRQMRSVADDLAHVAAGLGMSAWRRARDEGLSWIVVDLVHVVVHLFEPGQREFYDIEGLWGDATKVEWREKPAARGGKSS